MNSGAHPFAPGVIERHARRSRLAAAHQRRALLRWLVRTALFMGAVSFCGFAAGLITGALSRPLPSPPLHTAAPKCPRCGNNRQVWINQRTGLWTCHRAYCDTVISSSAQGLHRVNTRATTPADAHQLTEAEAELNTRLAAWEARQRANREQAEAEQRRFDRRALWTVGLIYGGCVVALAALVWALHA